MVLSGSDDVINVDTLIGPTTFYLPNIRNSGYDLNYKEYIINDVGGNSSVNPITIQTLGGDKANGLSSVVITSDGCSVIVKVAGFNQWAVDVNGSTISPISDKNYVMQQTTLATTWSVPHNLNKKCSVQVVNDSLMQIEGEVRWVNNNEVEITFAKPSKGWVYCN